MALSAATNFDVRTTGSSTNGGGFVRGATGTDYSQQDSPNSGGNNSSTTDAVANGTTTITSATASFTADIVGNIIYFAGGTGAITAQRRQVTAFTDANTITIDTSIASSTGLTMNIGGALDSLGTAGGSHVASNEIWVKAGSYTLSSTTSNVSGGRFTYTAGANGLPTMVRGYAVSHGDLGTSPVISAGSQTGFNMITGAANIYTENLSLDGNLQTNVRGISNSAASANAAYMTFANFTNAAINGGATGGSLYNSLITGCTTLTAVQVNAVNCVALNCTANSFGDSSTANLVYINCIVYNGATGFGLANANLAYGCISYGGSGSGFTILSSSNGARCYNCISYGNTSNGFTSGTAKVNELVLYNCASGGNGTDFSANLPAATRVNCVTLTADPFTAAASGDFSLNSTTGGGADLKGAGIPASWPGLSTTATPNIGPVHTEASSGGGGSLILGG